MVEALGPNDCFAQEARDLGWVDPLARRAPKFAPIASLTAAEVMTVASDLGEVARLAFQTPSICRRLSDSRERIEPVCLLRERLVADEADVEGEVEFDWQAGAEVASGCSTGSPSSG